MFRTLGYSLAIVGSNGVVGLTDGSRPTTKPEPPLDNSLPSGSFRPDLEESDGNMDILSELAKTCHGLKYATRGFRMRRQRGNRGSHAGRNRHDTRITVGSMQTPVEYRADG